MAHRVWGVGAGLLAGMTVLLGLAGRSGSQPEGLGEEITDAAEEITDSPGAAHAGLAQLAGEWTSVSVMSMPTAEGEGEPGTGGTAEAEAGSVRIEAILDGGFIAIHESGTMMGESFESMKVFGFNNAAGLYESTWIYTGSTAMMRMRGTSDDGGRIISFQAQYATAIDVNERFLVTMIVRSGDEFAVTLTALLPDGSAGPAMETVYSRVK